MLGREELARFGGVGRRRIFGLALRLFSFEKGAESEHSVGTENGGSEGALQLGRLSGGLRRPPRAERDSGREVELYTWSPEVRDIIIYIYSVLPLQDHMYSLCPVQAAGGLIHPVPPPAGVRSIESLRTSTYSRTSGLYRAVDGLRCYAWDCKSGARVDIAFRRSRGKVHEGGISSFGGTTRSSLPSDARVVHS